MELKLNISIAHSCVEEISIYWFQSDLKSIGKYIFISHFATGMSISEDAGINAETGLFCGTIYNAL